ncbi:MAG: STAS domain-containing protein [Desulfobacterales bacterium]
MEILKSEKQGEVLVAVFCGSEFNAAVSEKFKEESLRYMAEGHTRIALDLSNVKFMDSSGLGALVFFLKKANQKAGFAIFGIGKMVKNLLQITKTYRAFRIFENREDAVAFLSAS